MYLISSFQLITVSDVTLECWSAGQGRYFEGTPETELYNVCFSVYKNHVEVTLDITIRGNKLIQLLREVIPWNLPSTQEGPSEFTISYLHLLPNYPALRSRLIEKERLGILDAGTAEEIIELQLLVRDFLLERSIFEGFGFENLYEHKVLTAVHWQDMQHRSVHEELDYLDECVDLTSGSEAELSNDSPQPPLQLHPSIRSELRRAIRQHDYQAVASVLAQNSGCIDTVTLTTAIKFYDSSIFSLLIGHGAMVNGDESHAWAEPLYVAAKRGHIVAVEVLLQYGANIEGGNTPISATPLTGAASGGHSSIIQYLVGKGANVNGNNYKSPLSRAIKHGHTDIALYLVSHVADTNGNGCDVLLSRVAKGNINANDVRQAANVNASLRQRLLYLAAENGCIDFVKYLVSRGADVNGGDSHDLLSGAIKNGHIDVVEYLISHGTDVGASLRQRLLYLAAENGYIDFVKYLVSCGADVKGGRYHDIVGWDCHSFSNGDYHDFFDWGYHGFFDGVRYDFPLSGAAKNGHIDVVKYLVSHGADINGGNYHDLPLSDAAENGHIDVVQYLVSHGADVGASLKQRLLYLAAENGYIDFVKYLVSRGADVNGGDYHDLPLSGATKNGYIDVAEYLVSYGADVSACDICYCPRFAAIQARERHKIGRQLLAKLSKSHQRLEVIIHLPPSIYGYLESSWVHVDLFGGKGHA